MNNLVILRIIVPECHNNKTNFLRCFNEFRKDVDMVPRLALEYVKRVKSSFELTTIVIRLYVKVIANFRNREG